MLMLELFFSFFQIGLFSIGGGYAAMPLIQNQVVQLHSWLSMGEFADLVTIAEMTPGPIAINSATFVGNRVAGIPGALVATLGCVLPSSIIVIALAWFYFKYRNLTVVGGVLSGLRPAVVAMIASAGLSILLLNIFWSGTVVWTLENINFIGIGLFAAALFVLRKWKLSPILVMFSCGLIGTALYLII